VFVTVTAFELEVPAFTFVKLRLLGLEDSVTDAAVPVPLSASTLGELGALLTMLTVPLRLPAVDGANRTLNVAVLPAGIVAGVTSPLTLYALPFSERLATVKPAVPVLVIVMV
jgi:hypothetical protein